MSDKSGQGQPTRQELDEFVVNLKELLRRAQPVAYAAKADVFLWGVQQLQGIGLNEDDYYQALGDLWRKYHKTG